MTPEQISKLSDEDFSKLAGEVLQPEELLHEMIEQTERGLWPYYCEKCKKGHDLKQDFPYRCAAGSIDLTPDNAFKWRDWCVENYIEAEFEDAMHEVYQNSEYNNLMSYQMWLLTKATPRHYIEAAVRCVINAKGKA